MTELEKKANYYEKSLTNDYVENTCIDKLIQQSYKDGYEQGQKDMPLSGQLVHEVEILKKENEELKEQLLSNSEQLEKMKCWANCKWSLNCSQPNINNTTVVRVCKNCKDWELAE